MRFVVTCSCSRPEHDEHSPLPPRQHLVARDDPVRADTFSVTVGIPTRPRVGRRSAAPRAHWDELGADRLHAQIWPWRRLREAHPALNAGCHRHDSGWPVAAKYGGPRSHRDSQEALETRQKSSLDPWLEKIDEKLRMTQGTVTVKEDKATIC